MQRRRLRGSTIAIVFVFITSALGGAAPSTARSPSPVSPGNAEEAVRIEGRCPTFSWTAIEGARGYELVLYRVDEESPSEESTGVQSELLSRVQLPAGSTGWTPSLGRCLEWGGRYAWSVRAVGNPQDSEWSEASLFEVRGTPSVGEVEAAIELLRRSLRAREEGPGRTDLEEREVGDSSRSPSGEVRTGRGSDRRHRRPSPGLPSALPLTSDTTVTSKAAPALGSPSLTVDSNIALGSNSNLFKGGSVFLWGNGSNLGVGEGALASASGYAAGNTAVGRWALTNNTGLGASYNTAMGESALYANTTGISNTAIGWYALPNNIDASSNTAVGDAALYQNTVGCCNTAIGASALSNNTSGGFNIALGDSAGSNLGDTYAPSTDLSNNIFIGNGGQADEAGTIRIGEAELHDRTFIAGISGVGVSGGDVHVAPDGQLGVATSSRRFKEEIEPLDGVAEQLLELRPVTFRYRSEKVAEGGEQEVGLIAEEVAEVLPELVIRDGEGEPFGVRYELLSVLLLEQLQRQHEGMEALRRRLSALEEDRSPTDREDPWWRRLFGGGRDSP